MGVVLTAWRIDVMRQPCNRRSIVMLSGADATKVSFQVGHVTTLDQDRARARIFVYIADLCI